MGASGKNSKVLNFMLRIKHTRIFRTNLVKYKKKQN